MSLASRFVSLFGTDQSSTLTPSPASNVVSQHDGFAEPGAEFGIERKNKRLRTMEATKEDGELEERPPYLHSMLAGGIGGTSGDILMHSLDTVKTRQQGDPHIPPRYTSLTDSYVKIFRQEGVRKGLYGGIEAAMLGSFPGTVVFFGAYEYCKRQLLDHGVNPSASYLAAGFFADFAASVVYVPSEVLKTRLQLQGRYNNPYFSSGYNYRNTWDAARTITRTEGFAALYTGYKATIVRDLPFSALQFAFYEQERRLAKRWVGGQEIGLGLEVLTAATAGGMASILTCPLDVVKTRVQTQVRPNESAALRSATKEERPQSKSGPIKNQTRFLHSTPRTVPNTAALLDTSSVLMGLQMVYKTEGVGGLFRGVGPRLVWCSIQSMTMLVSYQYILRLLAGAEQNEGGVVV